MADLGRTVIFYAPKYFPKTADGNVIQSNVDDASNGRGQYKDHAFKCICQVGEPTIIEELTTGGIKRKIGFDVKIPYEKVNSKMRSILVEGTAAKLDFLIGGFPVVDWLRVQQVTERGHSAWITVRVESIR